MQEDAQHLNDILEGYREEERIENQQYQKKVAAKKAESKRNYEATWGELLGKVRAATMEDYKQWLAGYLRNGNNPTHSYNFPMERVLDEFWVAKQDFKISPLHGAQAIKIIVPEDTKFLGGALGHSNLYFIDGFKNKGGLVPIYNNLSFGKK